VASEVILKGIRGKAFLETMCCFFFFLDITQDNSSLLKYAQDVAKAGTGLTNVDQQGTNKGVPCWKCSTRAPISNSSQTFQVNSRKTHLQNNETMMLWVWILVTQNQSQSSFNR
jgi:hypothetical protein